MRDQQNKILGVVGRKGSGKSTALREILSCRARVVLFDTMGEHTSWIPNSFRDVDQCIDYLFDSEKKERFACSLLGGDESDLNDLCRAVFDTGSLCFAVEEIPYFSTANSQPEGLDLLSRMGRHAQVDLVWTAQRMAEVSRRLTSATDCFVLFKLTEPRDVEALADRCGQEIAQRVRELGLHERLVFDVLKDRTVKV